MILFRKVKEEYGWFSNMSPHPIDGESGIWKTAEAFFQAMRFPDPAIRELIRTERSPMGAKMVAKKNADKMDVVPRSDADLFLMEQVLALKVENNPELKQKLLDTGDEVIVEDVQARQNESGLFWGAVVKDGVIVKGQNHLGRLWMELRARLRAQRPTLAEIFDGR